MFISCYPGGSWQSRRSLHSGAPHDLVAFSFIKWAPWMAWMLCISHVLWFSLECCWKPNYCTLAAEAGGEVGENSLLSVWSVGGSWPFGRKSLLLASSCSSAVCERSHRQKASAVTLAHGLGQSYQLRVGRLTAASVVCCGNRNTCSSSHCTAAWRCPHRYVVRTNLYPEKHGLF